MYLKINKRRKPVFLFVFLAIAAIAFIAAAAISVNRMRDGNGEFLTNLWSPENKIGADPLLDNNPYRIPTPKYVKTILFEGTDHNDGSYRTDVLLLAAFNMRTGKINFISFPRDLWVQIPNYGEQRINVAHETGGDDMVSDTFAYNFGFRPDHVIRIDFKGFQNIIHSMGNITVNVEKRFSEGYEDGDWLTIEPGLREMNDGEALWYVRARKNSSDFDRNRRAQEVMKAMIKKVANPRTLWKHGAEILSTVNKEVITDMKLSDSILYITPLIKFFQSDLTTSFTISPNEAHGFTTDGGASVLAPDLNAIHQILLKVFWVE